MAVNLSRNTKVFYTTVIAADSGYTNFNTFEIPVMSGYSFSQKTDQQTIQINEAGATPNRAQRSFNTKLNPVDWSISTYIRPRLIAATSAVTAAQVTSTNAVATYTHASAHNLNHGDLVAITGATAGNTPLNRTTVPVNKVSTTVFTYPIAASATAALTQASLVATKTARVTCVERHLWNALADSYDQYDTLNTTPAWAEAAGSATLSVTDSDVQTLAPFALIFKVDNTYYKVANCAVNQATVSFGIDQIGMIAWSGFGTTFAEVTNTAGLTELPTMTAADTTANFITNKLSTVTLWAGISASSGTSYTLPITGGEFSYSNNLTYLTPELLGTVNKPIGYFTGTRAVSGNLTAYLKTGATGAGKLLSDILATSNATPETAFSLTVEVGGKTNTTRMEINMLGAMLQIPTVDIQDIVSTTIGFTAQKYTGAAYDLEAATPNEVTIKYFSA